MDQGQGLIRLALFGAPVRHSLSPRIHRAFAEQAGTPIRYDAIETHPGDLADALGGFARRGGVGCNITVPLKREAMALAESRSETVQRAGAANTLTRSRGGWHADNTDGIGLVTDLQSNAGIALAGCRVCILGAGGAVAGVLAELLGADPQTVVIVNRTASKARELVERHADFDDIRCTTPEHLPEERFDLLLNATSMGHRGDVPTVSERMFAPEGVCYDLNYGPAAEPLRAWCATHDVPYHDGLGMLVEQAAESFRIWTGFEPETQTLIEALRRR